MKKFIRGSLLVLLFNFMWPAPFHAQERDLNNELLVYVLSDSLEFPSLANNITNFTSAIVKSKSLLSVLQSNSVKK